MESIMIFLCSIPLIVMGGFLWNKKDFKGNDIPKFVPMIMFITAFAMNIYAIKMVL